MHDKLNLWERNKKKNHKERKKSMKGAVTFSMTTASTTTLCIEDALQNGLNCTDTILSIMTVSVITLSFLNIVNLSVSMLSVNMQKAECLYAEYWYAESYYAECHYADCRGAVWRQERLAWMRKHSTFYFHVLSSLVRLVCITKTILSSIQNEVS